MKQRIYFNEVVTRDGFQMEPEFVPTDTKVELIDSLSQCGYAKIEVTSFTSAKAIPMLRDAEDAGTMVDHMNPSQLGDYTRKELEYWGRVIQSAKITAE